VTSYGGSFNAAAFNTGTLNGDPQAFVIVSGEVLPATQVVAGVSATRTIVGPVGQAVSAIGILNGGLYVKFSRAGTINSFQFNFTAINDSFQTFLDGSVAAALSSTPTISKVPSISGITNSLATAHQATISKQNAVDPAEPAASTSMPAVRPYIAFAITGSTAVQTALSAWMSGDKSVGGLAIQSVTVAANVGNPAVYQIFARGSITLYPLATIFNSVSKLCEVDGQVNSTVVIP
jgi:hypothetical protein